MIEGPSESIIHQRLATAYRCWKALNYPPEVRLILCSYSPLPFTPIDPPAFLVFFLVSVPRPCKKKIPVGSHGVVETCPGPILNREGFKL